MLCRCRVSRSFRSPFCDMSTLAVGEDQDGSPGYSRETVDKNLGFATRSKLVLVLPARRVGGDGGHRRDHESGREDGDRPARASVADPAGHRCSFRSFEPICSPGTPTGTRIYSHRSTGLPSMLVVQHARQSGGSVPMARRLDTATLGDHLDRLYRAAWALTGSRRGSRRDLVQDTYARVLAKPRFLRREDDLGYLLRVLRNTFLNTKRTEQRRPRTQAMAEGFEPVEERVSTRPGPHSKRRRSSRPWLRSPTTSGTWSSPSTSSGSPTRRRPVHSVSRREP